LQVPGMFRSEKTHFIDPARLKDGLL